jgi:Phosphoserine phosphatase RsbU, N-terminal domain
MPEELNRYRRDYKPPFLGYLAREDEAGRRSAYELGRQAMRANIGLLEVVRIHNEAYLDVLQTVKDAENARQVSRASCDFLLELLAAFEMTQRGFMDLGMRHSDKDVDARPRPDA